MQVFKPSITRSLNRKKVETGRALADFDRTYGVDRVSLEIPKSPVNLEIMPEIMANMNMISCMIVRDLSW